MQEFETQDALIPEETEQIHIIKGTVPKKKQHADDVVLTQCILCVLLVLLFFALHWLKPEWQSSLIAAYMSHRDAAPVAWLDKLLESFQAWLTQ